MKVQLIRLAITVLLVSAVVVGARPAWAQDTAQEGTRSVNGMEMYYTTRGSGPPLVLLHGFGGCGQMWEPHLQSLAAHFRLIIPDLRGHGRSTNPSGQFTHRQSARDVFALLDQLGIRQFKAMGISTGGMTLLHMATQQPERVEAMVLIGATTYFPEQARAIMRGVIPDSAVANPPGDLKRCSLRGAAQVRELASQFNGMKDSHEDMSFTEPYLATISARTLVVHGDRDVFFPVAIPAEMYRAIPRAYLWIVPNGGHVPIMGDRAARFQETALAFLQDKWERRP